MFFSSHLEIVRTAIMLVPWQGIPWVRLNTCDICVSCTYEPPPMVLWFLLNAVGSVRWWSWSKTRLQGPEPVLWDAESGGGHGWEAALVRGSVQRAGHRAGCAFSACAVWHKGCSTFFFFSWDIWLYQSMGLEVGTTLWHRTWEGFVEISAAFLPFCDLV